MYSANGLFVGGFTENDLPSSVTISSIPYSRSGTQYGDTTNGVVFETDIWAKYVNSTRSSQQCLIDNGISDPFEQTYTVTYVEGEQTATGTVTRVGLCLWTGSVELDGGTVRALNLSYNDTIARGPQNQYKWTLDNFFSLRTKESPQSSPVGNYVFTGSQTWIVS